MKTVIMPRPEHPQPQLVRSAWMNLNGEWQFVRDHGISGKQRKLYEADSLPDTITVPFCMESKLSGIGDKDFCECVWYRKEIDLPADWLANGKRILLHIGACDYRTTVYVNGKQIGRPHIGGYVGFTRDITEALTAGKNVLTVCAEDYLRSGNQPAGKQCTDYASRGCLYTRTTGIWQTVWLESVPASYIKQLRYTANTENATLHISARLQNGTGKTMTATAYWNGAEVGTASAKATPTGCELTLPLSELHLWEVGKGGLYDLTLTLGEDTVQSYFGMRDLALNDQCLVINGKKVFQRLVLDQGFYPDGIYTAPTEQALIDDITRSMACGFNGARLHQKVFEPLFLYHCDRLGYLVWDELGNWGLDVSRSIGWKGYIPEWIEIVERDINHPAIIGWCPFNETDFDQDEDLIAYVADLTRKLDPTRPVIETSGYVHIKDTYDILDCHDYDQNPETMKQRYLDAANGIPVRLRYRDPSWPFFPRFVSEYGGIQWDVNSGLSNSWGYGNAPKTEEEFIARFKGLSEALLFNPYIIGFCYTQLTDVEQETNGLYTYDRQTKFDPKHFYEILTQKAAVEE
ncbi:MAG: beta-galactosidase [Ruminococcaceae bacterium]|nr:beta-galactosidase [Oscillospiraceae bacterium]